MQAQAPPSWLFAEPFKPDWRASPAQLEFTPNTVHIWRMSLDLPTDRLAAGLDLLSADERQRAARFAREQDRQRFIAARGALRLLLSRYLQRPPAQLVFTYNEFGKPALADASSLAFNLTHSEDLALCTVSQAQPLGIDVETERATVEFEALWPRISSCAERDLWPLLAAAQRPRIFFQLWTRKEAVIKALGMGLSLPLNSLTVLGASADLVLGEAAQSLRLQSFCPQPDYLAALATPGQPACKWFAFV